MPLTITPSDAATEENPFGEVLDRAWIHDIESSTDFWNRKPQLQAIWHAAMAERISPWGVLGVCMAHRLSHIPPTVVLVKNNGLEGVGLRGGTSLNILVGVTAKAGGGKSTTFRLATELIPPNGFPLPDGTGQGIVRAFAERKKITKDEEGKPLKEPYVATIFHRHSLTIHAPEVTTLNAEFAREGSKTGGMLRSMWVGETVGMTNADNDRAGALAPNMTRLCGVWGVQPHNADAIMAQAADGTPQRFLWVPANETRRAHPELLATVATPPPLTTFPFPVFGNTPPGIAMGTSLPKELADNDPLPDPVWVHHSPQMTVDVKAFNDRRSEFEALFEEYEEIPEEHRAEAQRLNMEAHLVLMRVKLAAQLGFLWGHSEPDDEDWELAGVLLELSMGNAAGVWKMCQKGAEDAAAARGAIRGIELDAAFAERERIKDKRTARIANAAYKKLAQLGPMTEGGVSRQLASRDRASTREALRYLEDEGKAEYAGTLWHALYKGNKLGRD